MEYSGLDRSQPAYDPVGDHLTCLIILPKT